MDHQNDWIVTLEHPPGGEYPQWHKQRFRSYHGAMIEAKNLARWAGIPVEQVQVKQVPKGSDPVEYAHRLEGAQVHPKEDEHEEPLPPDLTDVEAVTHAHEHWNPEDSWDE